VAALLLVVVLLPVLVSCAAADAKAPNTIANANAKAIPCFIISSELFKYVDTSNIHVTFPCRTFGTVDAIRHLLKID
jgi:hypothetical protein